MGQESGQGLTGSPKAEIKLSAVEVLSEAQGPHPSFFISLVEFSFLWLLS